MGSAQTPIVPCLRLTRYDFPDLGMRDLPSMSTQRAVNTWATTSMAIPDTRRPEVRQGNSYTDSSINLINRLLRISVKPLQILPSPETGDLTLSFPSLLLDPAVDSSPFPRWLMALQSCLGARPARIASSKSKRLLSCSRFMMINIVLS